MLLNFKISNEMGLSTNNYGKFTRYAGEKSKFHFVCLHSEK